MSIPVSVDELDEQLKRFGAIGYLVTVGDSGRPHVVSVRITANGSGLWGVVGNRSAANAAVRADVVLMFGPHEGFTLLVDGRASVMDNTIDVVPVSAVLHRQAN
jgi:hypothetical protein